jgi:cbb3-type cytochrome oxidase maturation protein
MNGVIILLPIALGLGLIGLAAFFWAMRSGQFDDPDGAASRILMDDDEGPGQCRPVARDGRPRAAGAGQPQPGAGLVRRRDHGNRLGE